MPRSAARVQTRSPLTTARADKQEKKALAKTQAS